MKLLDSMKDASLGAVILYSFTKGYGDCEISIYDYVLPLMFNDAFKANVLECETLQEALEKAIESQNGFLVELKADFAKYQAITNEALGALMLQGAIEYQNSDNQVQGVIKPATFLDVNEAIRLGELLKGNEAYLQGIVDFKPLKIGFLDSITVGEDIDLSRFVAYGELVDFKNKHSLEGVDQDLDVIITNKVHLDGASLAGFENLKLICVTATGFNNLDLDYLHTNDIGACNVKGYSTKAVASHGLTLMLNLNNRISYYDNFVKSGQYVASDSFSHFGNTFYELDGKVLTIIGMGAIGQEMARYATALGMKVQYYSTSGVNYAQDYPRVNFETALTTSDFISINAPLNDKTRNLFDKVAFEKMKPTAFIVNVGRGSIINEPDLVEALDNNEIAGAALDVFESEPLSQDSCLFKIKDPHKILLTPHIAWAPQETRTRVMDEIEKNIDSYLIGSKRNRL